MTSILVDIFGFITWSIGLLGGLMLMGRVAKLWEEQSKNFELAEQAKRDFLDQVSKLTPSKSKTTTSTLPATELPEKLKELIAASGGSHPEVEEIDSEDVILGVRFEAEHYPPGFDNEDEDE